MVFYFSICRSTSESLEQIKFIFFIRYITVIRNPIILTLKWVFYDLVNDLTVCHDKTSGFAEIVYAILVAECTGKFKLHVLIRMRTRLLDFNDHTIGF